VPHFDEHHASQQSLHVPASAPSSSLPPPRSRDPHGLSMRNFSRLQPLPGSVPLALALRLASPYARFPPVRSWHAHPHTQVNTSRCRPPDTDMCVVVFACVLRTLAHRLKRPFDGVATCSSVRVLDRCAWTCCSDAHARCTTPNSTPTDHDTRPLPIGRQQVAGDEVRLFWHRGCAGSPHFRHTPLWPTHLRRWRPATRLAAPPATLNAARRFILLCLAFA
jgi:hypothetical protein